MKLRAQLLTLSLATVLVPLFGWRLVQELELFLRSGQEQAMRVAARTIASALPADVRSELMFGRDGILPVQGLAARPIIDGYAEEWPEPGSVLRFSSGDGGLGLQLLAGRYGDQLYLFCRVTETGRPAGAAAPATETADGLRLFLRSARGLNQYRIGSAAPGPILVDSLATGGGQLEGYWQEAPDGYAVELALPRGDRSLDLSVGAVATASTNPPRLREAGTVRDERPRSWLRPAQISPALQGWLGAVAPEGTRGWIVDRNGWVVGDSGPLTPGLAPSPTWVERVIYRVVAGRRTELQAPGLAGRVRLEAPWLEAVLDGREVQQWSQDPDSAELHHTVAVPVELDGDLRGAVVLEARSDGLLLVTNRALGQLILTTLLLTLGLAAALWWFASRLSGRVQRLSGAVSAAMDDTAHPPGLPLTEDRDELGELARNNARLLRAVADYTRYLQKLAGRLSHELKTPLAITRSSLDNLASGALDEDSRRYLGRAREGLDRQAAIVRAMSEANRLEASVAGAEWTTVDLAAFLETLADAYRTAHPGREIEARVPPRPVPCRCAPDLLTQALDKLVDNALGLTGPGERVTLVLEPKGNYCHLKVRNTGTRLPETLRDQLFDSLVSMRDPADGGLHLGLGLYIVRLVAEAHGGHVEARNLEPRSTEAGDAAEGGVEFTLSLAAS